MYVPQTGVKQDDTKNSDDRKVQAEWHDIFPPNCTMENVGTISEREQVGKRAQKRWKRMDREKQAAKKNHWKTEKVGESLSFKNFTD